MSIGAIVPNNNTGLVSIGSPVVGTLSNFAIGLKGTINAGSTNGVSIGLGASISSADATAIGRNATISTNCTGAVAIKGVVPINSANSVAIGGTAGGAGSVAIGPSSNTGGFASCVALGASATCTAANQITLGTTSQTIRLNTISPLYATIPTFTSAQVGFISTTGATDSFPLTSAYQTIITTPTIPIGVYMMFVKTNVGTSTIGTDVKVGFNLRDAASNLINTGQSVINIPNAPPFFMSVPYYNTTAQTFSLSARILTSGSPTAVIFNGGDDLTNVQILRIA